MNKSSICFVAGKSGGHLLPCITLAKKVVEQNSKTSIIFFSTKNNLDHNLLQHSGIKEQVALPLTSLAKRNIFSFCTFAATLIHSFFIALITLYKKKPSKIISTGGAVSLPVCAAGILLKIPIELIELNVVPGKTIKVLAPFATTISLCFKDAQKYFPQKCYAIAYPIRFTNIPRISRLEAHSYLKLDSKKKTIFVVGGSQGSLFINNCIKQWCAKNNTALETIQIIHQIGINDSIDWQAWYAALNIPAFVFSFYHQIEYCYSAADLVICRAGAGTLFEVAFFNKPCITIPLETMSSSHQKDNANAFQRMHSSRVQVLYQHEINNNFTVFDAAIKKQLL